MHPSAGTVTSRSANHADAFGGERTHRHKAWNLTARQIRVALAAIDFYARYGAAPTPKYLASAAYGRYRQIIQNDIKRLIDAGVLTKDARHGIRTLRPTPAFRLKFTDELLLDEGRKGELVGVLKLQLQHMEGYHNV